MTRHRLLTIVLGAAALLTTNGPAMAGEPDESAPPSRSAAPTGDGGSEDEKDDDSELTTEIWHEPRVPADVLWNVLALPERAVELVFLPVGALVTAVERYRLDKRAYDLLRNDAGTIVLTPQAKLSFGDGLGAGASLRMKWTEAHERRIKLSGLYRMNGDFELSADLQRNLIRAEGRRFEARLDYEVDRDLPYYGIGADTVVDDERALRTEHFDGAASLELNERGSLDTTGFLVVGYRKERLSAGDATDIPPAGDPGDSVATPPGFAHWSDFVSARATVRYDTRDAAGRPGQGFLVDLGAAVVQEVDGESLSAGIGTLSATKLLPLLPDRRVLTLSAGLRVATPLSSSDEVPLHELTTLGRKHHLRGYNRGRFRDRHGWWATAEYSFPIYQYANTGVALDASLFFDAGHAASDLGSLADSDIRYSGGIGFHAAHDTLSILRLDIGLSPEGVEIGFSLGRFD